jgi:hypothetical protein
LARPAQAVAALRHRDHRADQLPAQPGAFQAGTLISPVLAIITTADPLVSIGVAYAWLGETITTTPLALAGELISLIVMGPGSTPWPTAPRT